MTKIKVNPPRQLKLPESVAANADLKKAFDDLNFIVHQLYIRTGAGNDFIQNEKLQKLYESISTPDINDLNIDLKTIYTQQLEKEQSITYKSINNQQETNINILHDKGLQHSNININHDKEQQETLLVSTDLTTTQAMTLVCNNTGAINITLNNTPDENETVTVKRVNIGLVNVLSSKNIDGLSAQRLSAIHDSLTIQFIGELNTWIIK